MEIEKIIYQTTRNVLNLDDKLRIATVFLFCYKISSKDFAELLYSKNHIDFIDKLNLKHLNYNVDFDINFKDKCVKDAFYKTLSAVILKYDSNGYYKAIFDKDKFALVISEIIDYNFDKIQLKKQLKTISKQLTLF